MDMMEPMERMSKMDMMPDIEQIVEIEIIPEMPDIVVAPPMRPTHKREPSPRKVVREAPKMIHRHRKPSPKMDVRPHVVMHGPPARPSKPDMLRGMMPEAVDVDNIVVHRQPERKRSPVRRTRPSKSDMLRDMMPESIDMDNIIVHRRPDRKRSPVRKPTRPERPSMDIIPYGRSAYRTRIAEPEPVRKVEYSVRAPVRSYGGYDGRRSSGYRGYRPSGYRSSGYGGYRPSGYSGYSGSRPSSYGGYRPSGYGGSRPSGYGGYRSSGYGSYRSSGYSRHQPTRHHHSHRQMPRNVYGGQRYGYPGNMAW